MYVFHIRDSSVVFHFEIERKVKQTFPIAFNKPVYIGQLFTIL